MITTKAVHAVGYYTGAGGRSEGNETQETKHSATSYYAGPGAGSEPAGQWSGRLAEQLGLTGEVNDQVMEQVFEAFTAPDGSPIGNRPRRFMPVSDRVEKALASEPEALPERIEEIKEQAARSTRENTIGMDLTFNLQKSVTVLHAAAWHAETEAIRSGNQVDADRFASMRSGIEQAIDRANRAQLEYVSMVARSRAGKGGTTGCRWLAARDLAVASFFQHTSRADDPHLHIHNVVLNRAVREDGQIRALDTEDLRKQKHAYAAIGERVLAEELAAMGIEMQMRPDGVAREVVGVSREAMALFSERTRTITKAMAPAVAAAEERLGRPLNKLELDRIGADANFRTRKAKEGDVDWDQLIDSWQDKIVAEMGQGLRPIAERVAAAMEHGAVARESTFSSRAIGAEAIHAVAQANAAWSRADLVLEIERRLPLLGLNTEQTVALIDRLTDETLQGFGVEQVAGRPDVAVPAGLVLGEYVAPSAKLYAAPVTLEAEDLIRRATVERRGATIPADAVNAWLDENMEWIGADQRAAIVGIASSNAALAQIVGPAGTGKSVAAGALAGVWSALAGGQVHGMAVSEPAANVLISDGVLNSDNIDKWLAAQGRLEAGAAKPEDYRRAVGARDVILVDEASMARTAQLDRIRSIADSVGARIVLMGDPNQLGAVGAGGVMELIADRAETYTLSEVRRFREDWEGPASLKLRAGDAAALREYDRRGRLVEASTIDEAIAAAARAAVADRVAGRVVSVTTDTNETAAKIANAVREHLVALGLTEAEGVHLQRTGSVAGIGDEILTRQIDRSLGVLNGSRFQVIGTGEDGSLSVRAADGTVRELPSEYVAEHVQLGYASTVHGAQGQTVDVGYFVTDGRTSAAAQYVALTRGRERNAAFVALAPAADNALEHENERGSALRDEGAQERPSARSVLADALERENSRRAARVEQEADQAYWQNMGTLLGLIEDATQAATRTRMEGDLDRLVEEGVLSTSDRARLASDQSSEHLSRLLRAGEQAGHDPAALLREAIEGRDLRGLKSLAQGISARITGAHDVEQATPGRVEPQRMPTEHANYLADLQQRAAERANELGGKVAEEAAAGRAVWAIKALGPVPEDPGARLEWETRAGAVAGYREAAGHEDAERAIGSAPGLTSTEKRAAWWSAWEALGRPEETRPEAALSDGALRARVSAWAREQLWAPPHADASLRQAELDAEQARREAILAEAAGDAEEAARRQAEAETRGEVARGMTAVAEARERWAAETAVTQDLAERAREELQARGLEPGEEEDRVSAEEWLALHRETVEAEDETRPVTEHDVPVEQLDAEPEAVEPAVDEPEPEIVEDGPAPEVEPEPERSPAHEIAPEEPGDVELAALVKRATEAEDTVRDRESEEAVHDAWDVEPEPETAREDEEQDEVAELV